mmetsp:Transcript_59886/g.129849  ORF Transcript_59886/g.129849 Transcript_59886/m.129849 type:complete len:167 (+) Transcript_59886:85-585(+)
MAGCRGKLDLDLSFLPGPEVRAPHLREEAWKRVIDKEQNFAMTTLAMSRPEARRLNPLSWEPLSQRTSSETPNVVTFDESDGVRLQSARSGHSHSRHSHSRHGSRRCPTASTASTGLTATSAASSALCRELEYERRQRREMEREIASLRAKLASRPRYAGHRFSSM